MKATQLSLEGGFLDCELGPTAWLARPLLIRFWKSLSPSERGREAPHEAGPIPEGQVVVVPGLSGQGVTLPPSTQVGFHTYPKLIRNPTAGSLHPPAPQTERGQLWVIFSRQPLASQFFPHRDVLGVGDSLASRTVGKEIPF